MPAPYTLELHPVVGIVNEITTTPSETLVLTLLPVLQGASAASNYSALDAAKADKTTVATLQTLVDTKATPADITAAIAALVDGAPDALNTLSEIATALQGDEATIATILTELNNRVRFDAAQSLTVPQQDQARSNIDAEKVGVAATLVAAVTTSSIGAATAAQGAKADTAVQSVDLAPVALSGSFPDLINKSSLFNLVYSAYVIGSNAAILMTDTLGQILGKLQAQINAREPTIASGTTAQYWRGDKSWQTLDKTAVGLANVETRRTVQTITQASGTVTIDLSGGASVFLLTLTQNLTGWSFTNLPPSGSISEIRIVLKQAAGSAFTCVSPASASSTAGGSWTVSSTLGATESLGLAIDSSGNKVLFPSGVYG